MTDGTKRIQDKLGLSPKLNKMVTHGLSHVQHQGTLEYLDGILKHMGTNKITYEGTDTITPSENFRNMSVTIGSGVPKQPEIRLNKTDLYPIRINFSSTGGHKFSSTAYLPDISLGNLISINGNICLIKPVLTDSVFTGTGGGCLIKTLPNKVNVKSLPRTITCTEDGVVTPIEVGMVHGEHMSGLTMPFCLLVLQQNGLSKYGLSVKLKKEWDGKGFAMENTMVGPEQLLVLIDKDGMSEDEIHKSMLLGAGLLYLSIYHIDELKNLNDDNYASILSTIHQLRLHGKNNRGKVVTDKSIQEVESTKYVVIETIKNYCDPITKKRLKDDGIIVENYIDIMEWVITNYHKVFGKTSRKMYIDSLYYTLYDITSSLYNSLKRVGPTVNDGPSPFNDLAISKIFARTNKRSVYELAGSKKNLTTENITHPGDNMYLGCTSSMEIQNRGDGVKSGKQTNLSYVNQPVTALDCTIGTIQWHTKAFNNSKGKVNLFIDIDENNCIVPDNLTILLQMLMDK